jgi:hypothetical protein
MKQDILESARFQGKKAMGSLGLEGRHHANPEKGSVSSGLPERRAAVMHGGRLRPGE